MATRTLSYICRGLYLSKFLLRGELLPLMQLDSLIVHTKLYPSLPTMLNSSNVRIWPVFDWCSKIGEGAFIYSFYLTPKVPADTPMYFSSQSNLLHLYQCMISLFYSLVFLSLDATNVFFNVLPFLGYVCTPFSICSWCIHLCSYCRVWQCVLCTCMMNLCCWRCCGLSVLAVSCFVSC